MNKDEEIKFEKQLNESLVKTIAKYKIIEGTIEELGEKLLDYKKVREEEQEIISYINEKFNKPGREWHLKQGSFNEDLNYKIDAKGYIQSSKEKIKVLCQIKSVTWFKLSIAEQEIYLTKCSEKMNIIDPNASQRLLLYHKSELGKIIKIYNLNIKKRLEKLKL